MITYLPYAIRDKRLVHISKVVSGLNCSCTCPECGGKLIARKGKVKCHHFAHYNPENCKGGLESALHLAAKNIIEKRGKLKIPSVTQFDYIFSKRPLILAKETWITFHKVQLEKSAGTFIPDITLTINNKELFVELAYTHFVDGEKQKKVENHGVSMVEIDISMLDDGFSEEDLETTIIDSTDNKKWIYNAKKQVLWNTKEPHLENKRQENDRESTYEALKRKQKQDQKSSDEKVLEKGVVYLRKKEEDLQKLKDTASQNGFEIIESDDRNFDLFCPLKIYEESHKHSENEVINSLRQGVKWDGSIQGLGQNLYSKSIVINGQSIDIIPGSFDSKNYSDSDLELRKLVYQQLQEIQGNSKTYPKKCEKCRHFEGNYKEGSSVICSFRIKLLQGEIKNPPNTNSTSKS